MKYPITLIATVGTSPAVLTETIWKLYAMEEMPDRVFVMTTTEGRARLQRQLLDNGIWGDLCRHMGVRESEIHFPMRHIIVPTDASDLEADDLRTYEDCMRFGDAMMEVVREECANSKRAVYASVAGGRKTMGAQLMALMQVFGRAQDKVYHVLVDEPFETAPFYYPAQTIQDLQTKSGGIVHAKDAKIELYEVPFIRIGNRFRISPMPGQTFAEYVQDIQDQLFNQTFSLTFDPGRREIVMSGFESDPRRLTARTAQWLLYLALKNVAAGKVADVLFKPLFNKDLSLEKIKLHLCYYVVAETDWEDDDWFDSVDGRLKGDLPKSRNDFKKQIGKAFSGWGIDSDQLFYLEQGGKNVQTNINRLTIEPERLSFRASEERAEELGHRIRTIWDHVPKSLPDYPKTTEDKKKWVESLELFFNPILKSD
jgi:CRISPR-associated protein (TIGR02584 family)